MKWDQRDHSAIRCPLCGQEFEGGEIGTSGKYRICKIYNLFEGEREDKYGLAIEKYNSMGGHWYVICFVKWDEHEGDCMIDCIGDRLLEVSPEDWGEVTSLIRTAEDRVRMANQ